MRILKSVQTKVCVDGSVMKEYVLDEPLTEGFLKFLKHVSASRRLNLFLLRRPFLDFLLNFLKTIKKRE